MAGKGDRYRTVDRRKYESSHTRIFERRRGALELVGPKPPPGFTGNGCTASPDYLRGVPLWVACRLHDWHYSGEAGVSRFLADHYFQRNLFRVCRAYGLGRFRSWVVSIHYSVAVRFLGWRNYRG